MNVPPLLTAPLQATPLFVIERAAQALFGRLLAIHPDLFDRLGEYGRKRYAFSPTDLPLHFLVVPETRALSVSRRDRPPEADARMSGPLALLLGLLEGRLDGDALFFARELTATGDMEAIVALRNALDDCKIDLPEDIGPMAGPLAPVVRRIAREIRSRALEGRMPGWN